MAMDREAIGTLKASIDAMYESDLTEQILLRLDSFNYVVTQEDTWMLGYSVRGIEQTIKNECNLDEIPEELHFAAIDMVCADFLTAKHETGQLEISTLDLSGAVTSIKEGDTSVNIDSATTDAALFSKLLQQLSARGRSELICYRAIKW